MYLIVGVCTTAVNWIVYTPLVAAGVPMTLSNAAAWFCAVVFAFFTNKYLVFKSKTKETVGLLKEIVSFFAARIVSGAVEIFLPSFLFEIGLDMSLFGIEGAWAKLVVSVLIIIMNYLFSKLFVFKHKGGKGSE